MSYIQEWNNKTRVGLKVFLSILFVFQLPVQDIPLPVKPTLQEQIYEPRVLRQFAWAWQNLGISKHSLTSKGWTLSVSFLRLLYIYNYNTDNVSPLQAAMTTSRYFFVYCSFYENWSIFYEKN